ncbi:MAG TPA: TIGR00730 family Rossman fold protein [Methylocystis sp.]|nr:TIGR00730 family Rossman fold protein [Methylocystis sp.]
MTEIRNICVYCGSSSGKSPAYAEAAERMGLALAEAGIGLVFGGGSQGLMGRIARATLAAGGRVTGIIPYFLDQQEVALKGVTELHIVQDMHTRKRLMFEKADAFLALPGGIGTLEELTEQLTLARIGRHAKPMVLLDVGGYWRPLLSLFAHMRNNGFVRPGYEMHYHVAERVEDVIPMVIASAARAKKGVAEKTVLERL